jgi:thiamine transport system substrate-binding protein
MDLMRYLLCVAFIFICFLTTAYSAPLTIYCRDAFMATWGQALLEQYPSDIKLVKMPSAGMMTRLRLEENQTTADLLLGIDTTQARELEALEIVVPFAYNTQENSLPTSWPSTALIPIGYTVLTILVHTNSPAVLTLNDLSQPNVQLIFPDPRTSTTGLEFLYWVQNHYGDQAPAFWQRLRPHILSYGKGLSSSFALFTNLPQSITVAYSTSPLYAMRHLKKRDICAIAVEGAPIQVYGTMVTAKGARHPLMDKVVNFLRSPGFQARIPEKDDLYPAISNPHHLPPLPAHLLPPPFLMPLEKEALIQNWLRAVQR